MSSGTLGRGAMLAAGTLVSRMLGAVRDAVIAAHYSLRDTDAFVIAFTLPNAFRQLLGEGTVAAGFVPSLASARAVGGRHGAWRFLHAFVARFGALLLGATTLGVLAMPWLVRAYAPGFAREAGKLALTVFLGRVGFPYLALIGLAAVFSAWLQFHGRFAVTALAPAWLNVALIAAPIVSQAWGSPVTALAYAMLVGGALHLISLLPAVWAQRPSSVETDRARPDLASRPPALWKPTENSEIHGALRLAGTAFATAGVVQINGLLGKALASVLQEGAQSHLYFARRLSELPQGLVSVSLATAALPLLSRLEQDGQRQRSLDLAGQTLRLTLFIVLPIAALFAVASSRLVAVVFGYGAFSASSVDTTGRILQIEALALPAVAWVRTLVPLFYARREPRRPLWSSLVNLGVFTLASALLLRPLGVLAIALASSLAAWAQGLCLWGLLGRDRRGLASGLMRTLTTAGLAAAAMAAAFEPLHQLLRAVLGFAVGAGTEACSEAAGWPASALGTVVSERGDASTCRGNLGDASGWATLGALGTAFAGFLLLSALLRSAELRYCVDTVRRRLGRGTS